MDDIKLNLWKHNKLALIKDPLRPVAFSAPDEYGANFLIKALDSGAAPLIWLELTEQDVGDPVAQGYRLASAVKRRFADLVLPLGVPFAYGLDILKTYLAFVGPVSVAASNIQFATAEHVAKLLEFSQTGNGVVLSHTGEGLPDLPGSVQQLSAEDLRLSLGEALELAAGLADEEEVRRLLQRSEGALVPFHFLLEERFGRARLLIPSPTGARYSLKAAPLYEGETLIRILAAEGSYRDALELAVERHPEHVAGIIEEAGHHFHTRGMHQRLYTLLSALPKALLGHDFTLFWYLIAAFRQDKHFAVRERVEAFLRDNKAPSLRAAYAGIFLTGDEAKEEARLAYERQPTPYTCFPIRARPVGCRRSPRGAPGRSRPLRKVQPRLRENARRGRTRQSVN